MALGVYLTNTNYGGDSYHDGGLYGILGYKINKNWEAYVYGQLSVANNYNSIYGRYAGYGPYGYGAYGYGPYGLECIQVIGATALCQEVMEWEYREPTC